jgi:hypothetical protein
MTTGEFLKIKLWNGNSRKYIYIPLGLVFGAVVFSFTCGRKTGQWLEALNGYPAISKKCDKIEVMEQDVRDMREDVRWLVEREVAKSGIPRHKRSRG